MTKKIYIVRHCAACGQAAEAELTEQGRKQAELLRDFFSNIKLDRIISSPFSRAVQSAEPLSRTINVKIEKDERLSERILSSANLPDWYEKLKETFLDAELKFEGGESSDEALKRIGSVVDEVFEADVENTMIVTHGNIMSLLLRRFNSEFDFECWKNLSNPDVFQLSTTESGVMIERIWQEPKEITFSAH